MPLPIIPLSRSSVVIDGTEVSFRAMSRAEALHLNDYRDESGTRDMDGAENFILMCGTGCTQEEAQAFRQANDVKTAGLLIDAIVVLSGIAPDDADPKAPSNGPS